MFQKEAAPTFSTDDVTDFECLHGAWVAATNTTSIANTLTARIDMSGMSSLLAKGAAETRIEGGGWFAFDAEL